jgi:hypothetical protein
MNKTSPIPGVWSRSVAVAVGMGLSVGLIAVFDHLWLSLFAKVACGFLLALLWLLVGAIFQRGFRWFFSRRALRFHGCVLAGVISLIVFTSRKGGVASEPGGSSELAERGEKLIWRP